MQNMQLYNILDYITLHYVALQYRRVHYIRFTYLHTCSKTTCLCRRTQIHVHLPLNTHAHRNAQYTSFVHCHACRIYLSPWFLPRVLGLPFMNHPKPSLRLKPQRMAHLPAKADWSMALGRVIFVAFTTRSRQMPSTVFPWGALPSIDFDFTLSSSTNAQTLPTSINPHYHQPLVCGNVMSHPLAGADPPTEELLGGRFLVKGCPATDPLAEVEGEQHLETVKNLKRNSHSVACFVSSLHLFYGAGRGWNEMICAARCS